MLQRQERAGLAAGRKAATRNDGAAAALAAFAAPHARSTIVACPASSSRHNSTSSTCSISSISRAQRQRTSPAVVARATNSSNPTTSAAAAADAAAQSRYPVLLAILLKLSAPAAADQLDAFVRAQPSATAVPFISWVADLEARAATAEERRALSALCERLVVAREEVEVERMDRLYVDSLRIISGGDEQRVRLGFVMCLLLVGGPCCFACR